MTVTDDPFATLDPSTGLPGHWFTEARVVRIGEICAELLIGPTVWIDRRKDSLTMLDDTAVRWKTSVDFELPASTGEVEPGDGEGLDPLLCAPLFVLPKRPSDFMAFDLEDETGSALSLLGRTDNARISAQALIAMATAALGRAPGPGTTVDLCHIATGRPDEAKALAARRLRPLLGDEPNADWEALARHGRVRWWITTLADTSIVAVLFRSRRGTRKRIRLSYESGFEQPKIPRGRRLKHRLGWLPWSVAFDDPFIEARSFHFEADAPAGMRIERTWHNTDAEQLTSMLPASTPGQDFDAGEDARGRTAPARRVHIYRPNAEAVGAGTGTMELRATSEGFLTGAWLAATLVLFALVGSAVANGAVAKNPTSAPALFLLLPGLVASYVGRPDRHALTSRLLFLARFILLALGLVAYVAGVASALVGPSGLPNVEVRADHLQYVLWPAAVLGVLLWSLLSVGLARSLPIAYRRRIRRAGDQPDQAQPGREFKAEAIVRQAPEPCLDGLWTHKEGAVIAQQQRDRAADLPAATDPTVHRFAFSRKRWFGTWVIVLSAREAHGGARAEIRGYLRPQWLLRSAGRWFVRSMGDEVQRSLTRYAEDHHA